jgi:hypothetical protein
MRTLLLSLAITLLAAVSLASSDPCSLRSSLLTAYDQKPAGLQAIEATHRELSKLMAKCTLGPLDGQSRSVFFGLLDREFNYDFAPAFRAASPNKRESAEEGIIGFQYRLSPYLDTVIRADDVQYKATVLSMGSGTAIAALGPPVKADVVRLATNPSRRLSGFRASPHYLQAAAFDALGIWIKAGERRFSAKEKAEFTRILSAALEAIDGPVSPGMHHVLVTSIVHGLGNSDDPQIAVKLRHFADRSEKYEHHAGELSRHAVKAAEDVEQHSKRRGGD